MPTDEQRASHARFAQRIDALPEVARAALDAPIPHPPFDPLRVRRIRVTGLGSSEAHARLLVACLQEELAIDAQFVPTGSLRAGPPADAHRDALIVFSQGLSPNARFALQRLEQWAAFALATAVPEDAPDPVRAGLLAAVHDAGGWLVRFPPPDEYGTLVRVAGPLAGCIAALRMAGLLGRRAGREIEGLQVSSERVLQALDRAPAAVERALTARPDARLDRPLGFLASGSHAGLLHNLRLKWLETLLCPMPPAWELLDFAHGPFQAGLDEETTWLALTREDAAGELELLTRLESLLDSERQTLLRLHATLPGPWALVEHETQLDHLVLHALAERPVDLEQWPGQGADGALYDLEPDGACATRAIHPGESRLETITSPELHTRVTGHAAEILIPLGATEQHGAHLPLATDSLIADALAERLCARHPGLLRLPALWLGCSEEHTGFAGTLSLRPETLVQLLEDVVRSLATQGFARAFVFSAHGGNYAALAEALPRLRGAGGAMQVDAFTDLPALALLQQQTARKHDVDAGAAGHHAGEFETSLLLELAPQQVRREAFAPGVLHPDSDAQALFYPALRAHAPEGVVGDPRPASATRASAYLDAWTDLLDDAYRNPAGGERRAAHQTKGVKKA